MHNGLNRVVMAVGAHADDIELWAGGTLLKYHDQGYRVVYVMSTNNMSGGVREWENGEIVRRPRMRPLEQMARRKSECDAAAAVLGTVPIHLDHPQRHYNTGEGTETEFVRFGAPLPEGVAEGAPTILTAYEDPASVEQLVSLILENDPEVILTHPMGALNIEHCATCLLVTVAFWKAVARGYQGGLLTWAEAITMHGERLCGWDTFVNYSSIMDRKMALVALHACQKPDALAPEFGHRQLGNFWGVSNGNGAAECFCWVRRPTRIDSEISGSMQPFYGPLAMELTRNSR
jgi:LmbE family N-acetylglucosaminyl deacetylase